MNQPIAQSNLSGFLLIIWSAMLVGCSPAGPKNQSDPGTTQPAVVSSRIQSDTGQPSFLGYAASGHLEHAYTDARKDASAADLPPHQCAAASIQRIFGVWEPASGTMRVTMLLAPVVHADSKSPPGTLQQQLTNQVADYQGNLSQPNQVALLELCPTDQDAPRFTGRAPTLDLQTAFENAVVRALPSRHSARDPLHFVVCSIAATDGSVEGAPDALVTIEVETP